MQTLTKFTALPASCVMCRILILSLKLLENFMWLRNEDFYAYFRSYKWVENFNNQQIRLGEFISPNYAHLLVSSSLWIVNEAFTQYVFLLMEKYGDNFRHHSPPTKVVWRRRKKLLRMQNSLFSSSTHSSPLCKVITKSWSCQWNLVLLRRRQTRVPYPACHIVVVYYQHRINLTSRRPERGHKFICRFCLSRPNQSLSCSDRDREKFRQLICSKLSIHTRYMWTEKANHFTRMELTTEADLGIIEINLCNLYFRLHFQCDKTHLPAVVSRWEKTISVSMSNHL